LALLLGVGVIVLVMSFAKRYKRCPSNKILVIYGKTGSGVARCIHGGAAFVWPLIQAYEYLSLEPFVVPIDLKSALSSENIRVTVPTTVTAAISTERGIMENAAIRLLGLNDQQIRDQAQDIILGQMRSVIATMRIEEINQDRQAFLSKVNEAVSGELEKIGLHLVNVNIKDIEDDSGYIVALGRRAAAEAINQANIDVAEQEKKGQIGVATRQRDQRVAVAAATAEAESGAAAAPRHPRAPAGPVNPAGHAGAAGGGAAAAPRGGGGGGRPGRGRDRRGRGRPQPPCPRGPVEHRGRAGRVGGECQQG
jgi:flotillin